MYNPEPWHVASCDVVLTMPLEATQQRIEGLQTTYWTSLAIARYKVVSQ
jgi:hypothetical protein